MYNLIDVHIDLTTIGLWEKGYNPHLECAHAGFLGTGFSSESINSFPFLLKALPSLASRVAEVSLQELDRSWYANTAAWRNDKLLYHKNLTSLTSSTIFTLGGYKVKNQDQEKRSPALILLLL